jgi:hypothetical protein
MTVFSSLSVSSPLYSLLLTASLLIGLISGCSTDIDPTHPYDPDNPKETQVQITLNLLLPNEGPEIDPLVLQWVHVEDPNDFGLLSITETMLEDENDMQKANLSFNKAIAGRHYVLFVQSGSGYTLNPQSAIFYVEENQQSFTFELGVE